LLIELSEEEIFRFLIDAGVVAPIAGDDLLGVPVTFWVKVAVAEMAENRHL
jgi:hypothetical protein